MKITKERLVAALKVAADSKGELDTVKNDLTVKQTEVEKLTTENTDLKASADIVNDPEVEKAVTDILGDEPKEEPAPVDGGVAPADGAPAPDNGDAAAREGQRAQSPASLAPEGGVAPATAIPSPANP